MIIERFSECGKCIFASPEGDCGKRRFGPYWETQYGDWVLNPVDDFISDSSEVECDSFLALPPEGRAIYQQSDSQVCRICNNKGRCDGQLSDGYYTWGTPIFNTPDLRELEKKASLEGASFHYPTAIKSCVGFEPAAH
jgi:hypothetical protein